MNTAEAQIVIRRIAGIWPSSQQIDKAVRDEWFEFLAGLDFNPAVSAVVTLRKSQRYRPSMAELKAAYLSICANQQSERQESAGYLCLPGEVCPSSTNAKAPYNNLDLYGQSVAQWVYCWRCNMAIRLSERDTTAVYTPKLGLRHAHCPHRGSAPLMPVADANERQAHWQKHGIELPKIDLQEAM